MARYRLRAPLDSAPQYAERALHVAQKTEIEFAVVKADLCSAVDLTGLTLTLLGRRSEIDTAALFSVTGSAVGADVNGIALFEVPATGLPQSESILAELRLTDAAGDIVGQTRFVFAVEGGL